jgi:hypothetical protein
MTRILHGKVHGMAIEPDEDLGVAEGQEVAILGKAISKPRKKMGEDSFAPKELRRTMK